MGFLIFIGDALNSPFMNKKITLQTSYLSSNYKKFSLKWIPEGYRLFGNQDTAELIVETVTYLFLHLQVPEFYWDGTGKGESLEGGADRPVTERLGGAEVVPQQPIISFR